MLRLRTVATVVVHISSMKNFEFKNFWHPQSKRNGLHHSIHFIIFFLIYLNNRNADIIDSKKCEFGEPTASVMRWILVKCTKFDPVRIIIYLFFWWQTNEIAISKQSLQCNSFFSFWQNNMNLDHCRMNLKQHCLDCRWILKGVRATRTHTRTHTHQTRIRKFLGDIFVPRIQT